MTTVKVAEDPTLIGAVFILKIYGKVKFRWREVERASLDHFSTLRFRMVQKALRGN
jgi:hypothetical protein